MIPNEQTLLALIIVGMFLGVSGPLGFAVWLLLREKRAAKQYVYMRSAWAERVAFPPRPAEYTVAVTGGEIFEYTPEMLQAGRDAFLRHAASGGDGLRISGPTDAVVLAIYGAMEAARKAGN